MCVFRVAVCVPVFVVVIVAYLGQFLAVAVDF